MQCNEVEAGTRAALDRDVLEVMTHGLLGEPEFVGDFARRYGASRAHPQHLAEQTVVARQPKHA